MEVKQIGHCTAHVDLNTRCRAIPTVGYWPDRRLDCVFREWI